MRKELLAPAGNKECLFAAIQNGADAVYLSGKSFGARKFANNFSHEELKEAISYAHLYGVKVYVTVNTIVFNSEVEKFVEYIDYLYHIGADALIMQDIGMISLVRKRYPDFEINASTQMHNHNNDGLALLECLGVKKAVLDRELSLDEITRLNSSLSKEVFIHGALCNSYSGCCLFSSMNGGRSGNRGECVQSCRLPYRLLKNNAYLTKEYKYLLSTKELNTSKNFKELMASDVTSFKIEGRMRSPAYVGYVTSLYRRLIDAYYSGEDITITDEEEDNLKLLFNRQFTSGYLFGDRVMNIATSNHQGLEIGKVLSVTPKKIKIKLDKTLYQEDGIRFPKSGLGMIANFIYDERGLLQNKGEKGDIIFLDNKINLSSPDILTKTSSPSFEREILKKDNRKVPIDISFQDNLLTFTDDLNNKVQMTIQVSKAKTRPTTLADIKEKVEKLGNTPFKARHTIIKLKDSSFIDMKELNSARRFLAESLIKERTKVRRVNNPNDIRINYHEEDNYNYEISVLARTSEQVMAALDQKVDRIYVDYDLYRKYQDHEEVYLRLPRVASRYNYQSQNILVTELGGLYKYKDQDVNIVSDYYLNIVNNYSINYLLQNNVKRVTLSPEIDYDNLDDYIKDKVEIIIYGRLELMLTKSCPIKEVTSKCPCQIEDKYYLEDTSKKRYPIVHHDCLTHIMHYKNIDYFGKLSYYKQIGIRSYRLELFDEDYPKVVALINKIRME